MTRIVILADEHSGFDRTRYFLRLIADVWREEGMEVVVLRRPAADADGDVAVLHVDLTVVPEEALAFVRRFPVAINGRTGDISKRRISRDLVRRGDGYDGPVIVKTDLNCGGRGEGLLAARGSGLGRLGGKLRAKLPWTLRSAMATHDYPVFASVRDVPLAVWLNPALVVERFLPERRDGLYCLRTWLFLGDAETHHMAMSEVPVVKSRNLVRREQLGEIPPELRKMRADLGFDYGKFDYAISDGRVVLYDANRTPALGTLTPGSEGAIRRIRTLATGLRSFL